MVAPPLTTTLDSNACSTPLSVSTWRHESSVGWNCRNGMIAPDWKVSSSVLIEFRIAQRNGISTQAQASSMTR